MTFGPKNAQIIVLYGNSLVVSSIAASLKEHRGLRVMQVDPKRPDSAECLEALAPDVVVFDLATVHPDLSASLLRKHPALRMIGVDLLSGKMFVLSGQQPEAVTTEALIGIIETEPHGHGGSGFRILPALRTGRGGDSANLVSLDRQIQAFKGGIARVRMQASSRFQASWSRSRRLQFAVACVLIVSALVAVLDNSALKAPLAGTVVGAGIDSGALLICAIGVAVVGAAIALRLRSKRR